MLNNSMVIDSPDIVERTRLLQTLQSIKRVLEETKKLGDKDHWFFSTDVLLNSYEQTVNIAVSLIDSAVGD